VEVDYPQAGVLMPAILCEVLRGRCGNRLKIVAARVTEINRFDGKWQCYADNEVINTTGLLIVANGTGINNLGLPFNFPVESVRGQVAILHANEQSKQIKKTMNAKVHITPAINDRHYLGATYTVNSTDLSINAEDNNKLLASLNGMFPGMFTPDDYCGAWTGLRTIAKDRVPVAGAVADTEFFLREYADLCHGRVNKNYPPARHLKGLYISAAHGSRGFTSSFLCAEIIVAQIQGEPSPVSRRVLDYLNPSRFSVNDLKKGRVATTK
jgi:tRNA 5-methylaminomethyl-2-thiouridine biosynthesis bifunctional protein